MGKTTLVNALCRMAPFIAGQEQHSERPFQALMKDDPHRYALANQLDYLLYRAEQEQAIRQSGSLGLIDGGLDLDFYGFTQLFHEKGYLTDAELTLCGRLYTQLRAGLGPPDLIVRLVAPTEVVAERYARRGRTLEIAERNDLAKLGALVDTWLDDLPDDALLTIDVSADDVLEAGSLESILSRILGRLVQ